MELKFFDDALHDEAFTTVWATKNPDTTNTLCSVTSGAGENLRTGRKVYIHSIHVKGEIEVAAAEASGAPHEFQSVRICLVLDTQTNGVEPAATDVMEAATKSYLSFRKLETTQRFKVLWDRTFTFNPWGMNEGGVNSFARTGTKKLFKINKVFASPILMSFNVSANPPTVAQIADNSLHIIGTANTTTAILSYEVRTRFRD